MSELSKLFDAVSKAVIGGKAANNLAKATDAATIRSRVYIDENLGRTDSTVTDILKISTAVYGAMVLQQLQLNVLIEGDRTVKDYLRTVGTESATWDSPLVRQLQTEASTLSIDQWLQAYTGVEAEENPFPPGASNSGPAGTTTDPNGAVNRAVTAMNSTDVTPKVDGTLPVGRMFNLELATAHGKTAIVPLNVILLPYIMAAPIAHVFAGMNSGPRLWNRFLQWKAGEIAFWKDLVFHHDLITQRDRIVRADKDGQLAEFLEFVMSKKRAAAQQAVAKIADDKAAMSNNIANTFFVFSENTVQRNVTASAFDLHKEPDRRRYFDRTMALAIWVVNQATGTATLYLNGIHDVGHYTIEQLHAKADGGGKTDSIMALAEVLNSGRGLSRF